MTYKLIVKEVDQKDQFGHIDEKELKLGEVVFAFKGKNDDTEFDFKKGDKVQYQSGMPVKINGEEFTLVSLSSLVKDYE